MRKKLTAALVAPLVLGLAACSGGGSGGSSSDDGSVELSYWLWDANQQPAYQACADAFHEANPDVTVTIQQYAWDDYWTKLTAAFVAGNAPDVFTDHLSKYAEFSQQKQIIALDELISADDVDLTQYADGLVDPWVGQDGQTYGLPKDWDTTAFFYNADLISQAGYTADDLADLTWNPDDGGTFEELVAHLSVDTNGVRGDEAGFDPTSVAVYGLGNNPAFEETGQMQWANFTGTLDWDYLDTNPWGTHYNFDDPEFQKTIAWYYGLVDKGYMPASGVFSEETPAQLGSGKVAMGVNGDWAASAFYSLDGITIGVAPGPVGPIGTRASIFNGLADSISSSTEHQEQAWEWTKFLGSTDCQDLVAAQAVVFPAIPSSTQKALDAFAAKGYDVSAFYSYVEDGRTFLPPITDHAAEVNALVKPALEAIYLGQADASSLTDLNDQVNAVLAQ